MAPARRGNLAREISTFRACGPWRLAAEAGESWPTRRPRRQGSIFFRRIQMAFHCLETGRGSRGQKLRAVEMGLRFGVRATMDACETESSRALSAPTFYTDHFALSEQRHGAQDFLISPTRR